MKGERSHACNKLNDLVQACVLLMFLIATEEDYHRVVETFGYYSFCFERLVLTQKRTKYNKLSARLSV